MRTRTLKSVLEGVAGGLGLAPDGADALDEVLAKGWVRYLNKRVKEAWEYENWPELMLVEERAYRDEWSAGTTYAVGDEVYYATEDAYYIAILTSTNKNPATETTYWTELTSSDFDRYVGWTQTGETAIGELEFISDKNPYKSANPGKLSWEISANGIQVSTLAGTTVFVKFRKRPNQFSYAGWDSTRTYAVGDLVYRLTTGESYKALAAGSNKDPATETAYWEKMDLPELMADFVEMATLSDALRENGRGEDADAKLGLAYAALEKSYEAQVPGQGQTHSVKYAAAY